ncbi:MAG: acyl carrier protein [Oscillospiraceae bacterium]|nr:acyl carrier protein [Oscillospiraceae bacterium]
MFEYVCKILADQLGLNAVDITAESKLVDDLGADSLDVLQMLMLIEDTKGITIPDEDLADFRTVGDVASYLEQHA